MKNRTIIVLMITLLLNNSLIAQTPEEENVFVEINTPNFLVNNQLSPEIIRLEYSGGVVKGTFKDEAGVELNKFNHNSFIFSGYPITLINKRHQQLYLGGGYVQDTYSDFESDVSNNVFEESFQSVYVNVFLNTRIKNMFYWFSYLQGGVNGTKPFAQIENTFNVIAVNKVNMKVNRNMNIGLGITYVSNLGDPLIIPAIVFVYSSKKFLINVDFPVKVEIEGILAYGKFRPIIGISLPASSYYLENSSQNLSYLGTTGYVGLKYRVFDLLYLHGAYQTNLGSTFELGQRGELMEIGTLSGQGRFVLGLNIQVAKFIPYTR